MYSDFIEFNDDKILDDFYYFDKQFTDDEFKKIDVTIKKYNESLIDGILNDGSNKDYRRSKIAWIPINDETKWLYKKIGSMVNIANNELWKFDISGMSESIQYGEYHSTENGHYDWHMDLGGDVINRKISVVIQLSDPEEYEGGELQFMLNKNTTSIKKEKGLTVVFPSYFLHRVTPVTKGIRKSLVIWITGKAFR